MALTASAAAIAVPSHFRLLAGHDPNRFHQLPLETSLMLRDRAGSV
jgi:hypothetical protein